MDEDFDYKEAFDDARRRGPEARPHRGDDHLAGLVARRLRPLRAADDPAHLAPGRHLPHRGRPRRRRRRRSALRAAEQLARQRQPRQGPPPPVAGQAEVRPEGLLGRPPRARRQRRPRVDGLRDLRVRLRPRGHLGARGDLLGSRGHLARRRALQRRARARRPVRSRADGAHLREPRGPERRRRPGQGRHRHPRDVPPHGHERRGDRRAHRRRSHLRQGPRRRRPRPGRSGARGLPRPRHGPRLDQRPRHRQGHRHHHQRARGRLEPHAHRVEQRLLGHALRLRVGARPQPGGRPAVAPEGRGRCRHRAGRAGPQHQARADDGHHRPRAAPGPGVPEDLGAVPRQPRRVRRCLRPRLVQAAAPRHGSGVPVPRPLGARAAAVAGPGARRRGRADRRRRHRVAEADDPRLGPVGLRPRLHGVGVGGELPRHRQARWRQRRSHPPGPAEGLGGQRPEPDQRGAVEARRASRAAPARTCRWPT